MTSPAQQQPGDRLWTVYTSWRAYGVLAAAETCETHPDWPAARRQALSFACCAGVRYVTVQDPGDVVVGEYDRYTNRWREYARPFGPCGSEREPDGELCTTELYARPGDVQVKCPGCGGWHGVLSRPDPRSLTFPRTRKRDRHDPHDVRRTGVLRNADDPQQLLG